LLSHQKRKKKKRVWRQFCEWLSMAVAHLPAAVSLLLLEALIIQISGVTLTLTWPCRLSLLRVLLDVTATATSFPLSKHTGGGDIAPAFLGLHVYLQFT
jgi:peptidoglycan biosynthesis protein MviN/MurJ (putative lipid II flippase)